MSTSEPTAGASSAASSNTATPAALLHTPLNALNLALGARMVPFAGYSMAVQYPAGLVAEHHHTRQAASLFDVSHMGQLRLVGDGAAAALETLLPVDVLDLPPLKQRYSLLLGDDGGIIDDLMLIKRRDGIFIVVNGARKAVDMQYLQERIGQRCEIVPMPEMALLALQGPQAVQALERIAAGVGRLLFMTGDFFQARVPHINGTPLDTELFITRSGYSGEDGFEISVHQDHAEALAQALLAQPEVKPAGLGSRNALRLEAGLCLYGNDIDTGTTPSEANLQWCMQKVRRSGGARAGGFAGAATVLAQLDAALTGQTPAQARRRVGLIALERIPVREPAELQDLHGQRIGSVTSGLLSPTLDKAIAMGYVSAPFAALGTRVHAIVRGKAVAMEVSAMPFVPQRYYRG